MNTVVLGLGISGKAVYEFLMRMGEPVIGIDDKAEYTIDFSLVKRVIVSPGIPRSHPVYQAAIMNRIPLIGEAQFALSYLRQKIIGITGTNGKTTVTLLTQHILQHAGYKAVALGNVGIPFASYIQKQDPEEIIVAELSSYQLETLTAPVLDAAIVTNITPDHLDRYDSIRDYALAKANISRSLKAGAPLYIYNQISMEFGDLFPHLPTYGRASGMYITNKEYAKEGDKIIYFLPSNYKNLAICESENLLASWLLVSNFGVHVEQFLEAVKSFKKPPHRIEYVETINQVAYYNDSKGTNLDAVLQAIEAIDSKVILIAGGADKGFGFTTWRSCFINKVISVIAIGQTADKICKDLQGVCHIYKELTLASAVKKAREIALPGETVLLSPGCSSFDMFVDYKHRGEEFKRCVMELKE